MPTTINPYPSLKLESPGFFLLRSPLYAFDTWLEWTNSCKGTHEGSDGANAIQAKKKILRSHLKELLSQNVLKEALRYSSKPLLEAVHLWQKEPDSKRGRSAEASLVAFFTRICTRPAPFGLSAGISVGFLGKQTVLRLAPQTAYRKKAAIDVRFLYELRQRLINDPSSAEALIVRVNPTLYIKDKKANYIEISASSSKAMLSVHRSVSATLTPELSKVLALAEKDVTLESLLSSIVESGDDREDAERYLHTLIDNQILCPTLEPIILGDFPDRDFLTQMHRFCFERTGVTTSQFSQVLDQVAEFGETLLGSPSSLYDQLDAGADTLVPARNNRTPFLHVDLFKPAPNCTIDKGVIQSIAAGISVLQKLGRPINKGLSQFARLFRDRFGDRSVPLLIAIDNETGVPFDPNSVSPPSAILRNIPRGRQTQTTSDTWSSRDALLLRLTSRAVSIGQHVVELRDEDLEGLNEADGNQLPCCLSALATLYWESGANHRPSDPRLILEGYGSSAALLGRFCSLDPELRRLTAEMLRREAQLADVILADVVHFPSTQPIGNVVARPQLLDFAIPIFGATSVDEDHRIPLSDLVVSVDHDDKVILTSIRHRKRVIPRLSNAHNYATANNLSVYRFLCTLQIDEGAVDPKFTWGEAFSHFAVLPRIVFRNVVLARAQWRLFQSDIQSLFEGDEQSRMESIGCWRRKYHVPQFVLLAEGDRLLPLDLNNVLCVHTLAAQVKGANEATLLEMLPAPEQLALSGPEGRFHHQIVVPLFLHKPPAQICSVTNPTITSTGPTSFICPPGSEWVYVKLYTSPANADAIITLHLPRLLASMRGSVPELKWFFIRYEDENGYHLRIRFLSSSRDSESTLTSALKALGSRLTSNDIVSRVVIDTYQREVHRYGGLEGMRLSEEVFFADSECVMETLMTPNKQLGDEERLLTAIRGVDELCNDFNLTNEAKRSLMSALRDYYRHEFDVKSETRKHISQSFQKMRGPILSTIANRCSHAAIRSRSHRLLPLVKQITAKIASGEIFRPSEDLISAYIHLHANRLLRTEQRRYELVLYDWLYRAYDAISYSEDFVSQKEGCAE